MNIISGDHVVVGTMVIGFYAVLAQRRKGVWHGVVTAHEKSVENWEKYAVIVSDVLPFD
ncbi:hypothetical protein OG218_20680 [Kineococcus sp. NBC_00420]|uniref:hypothetical protein n=1 Tax=Kineococcus sp. NBC_00420 TaxID=2903564 RepID=UPI002E1FE633